MRHQSWGCGWSKQETSRAKTGIKHRSDKEGGRATGVGTVKTRFANAGFQQYPLEGWLDAPFLGIGQALERRVPLDTLASSISKITFPSQNYPSNIN